MRPVDRPPWNPEWAALDAGDAAAIAFGQYCAACEIPLPLGRIGWNADTGQIVSGPIRAADWDGLLVLCRHCAHAASRAPENRGMPLLPDRDTTFALGDDAPFDYRPRTVEIPATDGGVPEVVERVFVMPNGKPAADAVRLFGLNTALPVDPRLRLPLSANADELPLSGEHRRRLIEFDDPRRLLRTAVWEHARDAAERYREETGDAGRARWARMLARAVHSRGFWSVWAAVLGAAPIDQALVAGAMAVPTRPATLGTEVPGGPEPGSRYPFPATRLVWPPSSSDHTGEH